MMAEKEAMRGGAISRRDELCFWPTLEVRPLRVDARVSRGSSVRERL